MALAGFFKELMHVVSAFSMADLKAAILEKMAIFIYILKTTTTTTKYVWDNLIFYFRSFRGLHGRVISKHHWPLTAVGSTLTRGVELYIRGSTSRVQMRIIIRVRT
jgi:hypothetical protein